MELREERLSNCVEEVADLIADYYARTNAQEGIPKLMMHWPFFLKLDKKKSLVLYTARDEQKLVGVGMYLLMLHPQHYGMLTAICNTLGVNPDYRGKGIGTSIVKMAEMKFRDRGVKMLVHGHRTIYKTEPLFPKLGFVETDRMFTKVL
jgi:GNAT superfamily N-acetyltransferase